jgi:D-alanyl-D-alanine carboxypeptidase/D-alanyl-D-alanine-endopeptidase (penicillin-binding protein 4)
MMKIFTLIVALMLSFNLQAHANIDKIIRDAKLEKSSLISISVQDTESGRVVYSRSDGVFVHPASAIKTFTFAAILDTLGEDYTFDTTIYSDPQNNLYIKLGADPLLTDQDLRTLAHDLRANFNVKNIRNIYIDDTIIDRQAYPDGWLTDDYFPANPKLSAYTLNQNRVSVRIQLASDRQSTQVFQTNPYKISVINETVPGPRTSVVIQKIHDEDSDIINLTGTVAHDHNISIPVNNPRFFFIANFKQALAKEKINHKRPFQFAKTPENVREIAKISRTIAQVGNVMVKASDNFSSEIAFKVAGGKHSGTTGSTRAGLNMFFDFCEKLGINTSEVRLADASGISRYNLVTTSWLSDALVILHKNTNIAEYMAQPNEGTLARRLVHLRGRLRAKTGSLNGVSALSGYVTTQKGRNLAFAIVISNFNKKSSIIKSFEDDLIDGISKL